MIRGVSGYPRPELLATVDWLAENIATFLGAWVYPNQTIRWTAVPTRMMSSWFLLVIISFVIVADLKHWRDRRS